MAHRRFLAIAIGLAAAAAIAQPQMIDNQERTLDCSQIGHSDHATHCEMKEFTVPATGRISVDGNMNGGASVKGWSRGDVLVRAQVRAQADTDAEARAITGEIRIQTAGGQVRADGPRMGDHRNWSVSYEIFVPHQTDVSLRTHNGGVAVSDVRGRIEFEARNGGVSLRRLAGSVRGHTTNGGLSIELAGSSWDGEGLDAETTNGGVSLKVPDNYSARLETGTVNGRIRIDFPVTVNGEIGRRLSTTLGAGGPLIRVVTTNGGVSIKRT